MSLQKSLRAYLPQSRRAKRQSSILGVAALALAGSAMLVGRRAAKAEREHPPKGRFVTVDGVRLHYLERGSGRPVVFLHGNGAMVEDMLISGVIDQAARALPRHCFRQAGIWSQRAPARPFLDGSRAGRTDREGARRARHRAAHRRRPLLGHAGGALALPLTTRKPLPAWCLHPAITSRQRAPTWRCSRRRPFRSSAIFYLHGRAADRRGHRARP